MDRVKELQEILALDPRNSLARYGLAMEMVKQGETGAAMEAFDTLLANDPDSIAGYQMSAQTLLDAGRIPEAIERLRAGIGCAARRGNSHALNEMQNMLDGMETLK